MFLWDRLYWQTKREILADIVAQVIFTSLLLLMVFFILLQIKRGDPFRHCRANYLDVNYEVFAGILSFVSVTAIMALDISRDNINTIDRQKQRRKY